MTRLGEKCGDTENSIGTSLWAPLIVFNIIYIMRNLRRFLRRLLDRRNQLVTAL